MCKTDYIMNQGADFIRAFIMQDENKVPIDLTGASAIMQIRTSAGGALLAEIYDGAGITITPLDGRVDLHFTAAETAAIITTGLKARTIKEYTSETAFNEADGPTAIYAIELTYSGGIVDEVLRGSICLTPEVVA